ncbi:phage replisome organizer N-terminal domain-containing protein [Acetobacterium carbinolicum]|uniref:phage replisome organizer N-terminal domain-containing protein n=1 Tax=Acetobacterium carbinolicum TaxID=52690 RepID=UPI0039BFF1DF
MAKNKRYYWLKLKESFFREKEIKKMRRLENGGDYIVIYLKLILLSINSDGCLIFTGNEESMFEQLALEIDEDEELIKETIDFCIKNSLLEIDGDEYLLPRIAEFIGSETDKAELMRRKRAKDKVNGTSNNVTSELPPVTNGYYGVTSELPPVTNCYTEIEKKKDLEEERDLNIDLEKRLKEKREEYKRNNKTKTEDLEPISQSIPPLSTVDNNSISLSAEEVQYFIDCWSNLNVSDPIRKLNEKQTEKLTENVKLYGDGQEPMETIGYLIDSITDSSYLMGDTEHRFQLLIDWVLKPENWKKIIDRDYKNWEDPEI